MSIAARTDVVVSGSFDNMRAPHVRLLHEASKLGSVHVSLWDDATVEVVTGQAPKFPEAERLYYVQALSHVSAVTLVGQLTSADELPEQAHSQRVIWVVSEDDDNAAKRAHAQAHGLTYQVITGKALAAYPAWDPSSVSVESSGRDKVLVTGCYDWFHTGHVRFFEEVSELGDLYVVVGHDANIEALKGKGHPMFKQDERRYIAGSIRYVTQALISTGHGWLDAEPEIERIKPDKYAVNEDGDRPVKKDYCAAHGIEYMVLKRLPKPGLTRRESTHLRGF
ncbi:MAG: adenylyltransferase/cytidyltransferase family protein [Planctomycetes bacterium]|nr:adenylyltransferase/cytidyltransferase family protein [Planctomycetota bacterium]